MGRVRFRGRDRTKFSDRICWSWNMSDLAKSQWPISHTTRINFFQLTLLLPVRQNYPCAKVHFSIAYILKRVLISSCCGVDSIHQLACAVMLIFCANPALNWPSFLLQHLFLFSTAAQLSLTPWLSCTLVNYYIYIYIYYLQDSIRVEVYAILFH